MSNKSFKGHKGWFSARPTIQCWVGCILLACGSDSEPTKSEVATSELTTQTETASDVDTIAAPEGVLAGLPELEDMRAAVENNDFSSLNSEAPSPVLARVNGHQINAVTFALAARQWPASSAEGLTKEDKEILKVIHILQVNF